MGNIGRIMDNELEKRYERYKDTLRELTIMSDIFMRNVFKKRERVEYVLRIIMEKDDLHILEQTRVCVRKWRKFIKKAKYVVRCVEN